MFSRRGRPGHEPTFERWAQGITAAARRFPGHLDASVMRGSADRDYHIVYRFVDHESYHAWMESDERARWLAEVEPIIEGPMRLQETTGLEAWFTLPGRGVATVKPPPRWKMWLVSFLAIYPLVLVFQAFLARFVEGWPLVLRAAVLPFGLLTLMTYLVMPVVTRLIRPWLERDRGPQIARPGRSGP